MSGTASRLLRTMTALVAASKLKTETRPTHSLDVAEIATLAGLQGDAGPLGTSIYSLIERSVESEHLSLTRWTGMAFVSWSPSPSPAACWPYDCDTTEAGPKLQGGVPTEAPTVGFGPRTTSGSTVTIRSATPYLLSATRESPQAEAGCERSRRTPARVAPARVAGRAASLR